VAGTARLLVVSRREEEPPELAEGGGPIKPTRGKAVLSLIPASWKGPGTLSGERLTENLG